MNKETLISRIRELSTPMEPIPTEQESRLRPLRDIQCVALDFYGTMFISGVGDIGVDEEQDSKSWELFREALNDSGFENIDKQASRKGLERFSREIRIYEDEQRSRGIDHPEPNIVVIWFDVLQSLLEDDFMEGTLTKEVARRFAVEYEFRFNPVCPMPDLLDTLETLHQKRFILGIISNSQFYTPLAFEALSGRSVTEIGFDEDLLVWSYQASVKKPSLQFYERFKRILQSKHKMQPEQVLYVGNDMLKDVMPAATLGMKTALFAGDSRSLKLRPNDPRCSDIEPDIVITELSQILECLSEHPAH